MYICRKFLEVIIMETLTKIALERLNFEIIEEQEYTISDTYKKELHNSVREWELSPETGISLEEARKLAYENYGRI